MKKYLARIKKNIYKSSLKVVDAAFQTNYYWDYTFRKNGYHDNQFTFSDSQIAFVHLPKTGGTSFYKLLAADTEQRFVNLKIHRPISIHCPPSKYKYITIIRNPIDRVWSLYQMVLREPKGYPYRKYAIKGLDSFLQNCWEANNMACRYYTAEVNQQPNQETFSMALKNLDSFYSVLSFEHFHSEVVQFLTKHKIKNNHVPHERKHNYSSPIDAERALIASYNKYDVQLFETWNKKQNNG